MKEKLTTVLFAVLFTLSPLLTMAQGTTPGPAPASPGTPATTPGPAPTNPGGRGDLSYSLENPLAFDSIQSFIIAILNIIIVLATPIVVIFIILAGFKYVTARGNATQVQEATRALTYAIIGGVLIIGAVAIAEIIRDLVTSFS